MKVYTVEDVPADGSPETRFICETREVARRVREHRGGDRVRVRDVITEDAE